MTNITAETTELIPVNITLSDEVVKKVYELIIEEGNNELKLRIFVQGGGCSGFQYGFTFEEEIAGDDFVINKPLPQEFLNEHNKDQQITFLVDSMSYMYLEGANIDYKDDIEGSQFVINNPNATTTCGCGSSFA